MATKNAHVFASSSFGFGYTNLFQSKERRQHHSDDDDEERETRDEKGKEGGEEEEEEDVLRLFVFFSEFRRGVVFVSRVESKRG